MAAPGLPFTFVTDGIHSPLGNQTIDLERTRLVESPYVTHLFYTVHR